MMAALFSNATLVMNLDAPHHMSDTFICFRPSAIMTDGVWQNENPFNYSLPLFILQLIVIMFTIRATVFVLKFLGQPKVIAEIIGGVLLGPSGLGNILAFGETIFPLRSIMVLETAANVGLLYFLFLVGVETDLNVAKRANRHAIITAIVGVVIPLMVALSIALLFSKSLSSIPPLYYWGFTIFFCVNLSVTAFPVLARVIADLKLFDTELARVCTPVAIINDMIAWTILFIAVAFNKIVNVPSFAFPLIFGTITFVLFCFLVLRPAIMYWIVSLTPEGENFNELHICLILTGVLICGFITDALGTHSVLGAFIFGLIIPNGRLSKVLLEKYGDFVSTLWLPLYFAICGLRANMKLIQWSDYQLPTVIITASIAKVVATSLVALYYNMKFRESLALGLLMNTKGLMEIIINSIGSEMKIFNDQLYTTILALSVGMTAITAPTITFIFRTGKSFISYKLRTIQRLKGPADLKIVVCTHNPRNVPAMINLLEASHATKKSHIHVYAVHLVELTGSATAVLIEHNAHKTTNQGTPKCAKTQSENIANAFERYAQQAKHVIIQCLTAISPYATMHEDICDIAQNNQTTLIIVPFHKHQTVDGSMESTNPALRTVNQNVLANAPCSVGILIDRGLGGSASHISHHIAVIFIGGPDDREALTYGWRMAGQPGVSLTVMRFVVGDETKKLKIQQPLSLVTESHRQKQLDDECIGNFILRNMDQNKSIYREKVVNNSEETLAAIRSMDSVHDLYIVGRRQDIESPIIAGLNEFSECQELGAIGDFLASSDFVATISVLVVQQYVGEKMHGDCNTPSSTSANSVNQHTNGDYQVMQGSFSELRL